MEFIKIFFTESPTIIGMLYIVAGVSLGGSLLFNFLPEEKALQWFVMYRGYEGRKEEYDWAVTLKRQTIYLFSVFIYSLLLLFLTYLFGVGAAKMGLSILVIFVLFSSFRLKPIKKDI